MLESADRVVFARCLRKDLEEIISSLRSSAGDVKAMAVESTFNWPVDGLSKAGLYAGLVNTAAVAQHVRLEGRGTRHEWRRRLGEHEVQQHALEPEQDPFARGEGSPPHA